MCPILCCSEVIGSPVPEIVVSKGNIFYFSIVVCFLLKAIKSNQSTTSREVEKSLSLEVIKKCVMWYLGTWQVGMVVVGGWLDYIILEVFSNLNEPVILSNHSEEPWMHQSAVLFLTLLWTKSSKSLL